MMIPNMILLGLVLSPCRRLCASWDLNLVGAKTCGTYVSPGLRRCAATHGRNPRYDPDVHLRATCPKLDSSGSPSVERGVWPGVERPGAAFSRWYGVSPFGAAAYRQVLNSSATAWDVPVC